MAKVIDSAILTTVDDGNRVRTAEASELGFKPGEWPDELLTDGRLYSISNAEMNGDSVSSVSYFTDDGCYQLVIIND